MRDSKEHILKTSFSLFLQKSFKEVTMNDLVNAAGLSKGAFYHYFDSKEKLYIEVINTFFFDRMQIDYDKLNHNSLREFYHGYVREIIKLLNEANEYLNFEDTKAKMNFFMMMFDALNVFPGFRDKIIAMHKTEHDAWTKVIKMSRGKGEFISPMSDEQIARMFIYSNDGIGLHLLLDGDLETIDKEMLNLWNNFYKELLD
ncbi:MAG: TetR/AcrR family transcriptional regulator [Calditrichaceae bacterium]|nr:TetR/AcrR family transcriptional regulator [Calditrichaceae bacterium]MBN2708615.1 TetR/AcrR family transcriptional regulator [Calditrichaceae bacterium]RQV95465.1 MAG: TetR/AcrR family transcriptional regulator [Calditrichota bacterium]